MAIDLESGVILRLSFRDDMRLEYRCCTQVSQQCLKDGKLLGKKEHEWDTKVQQRVLRVEGETAHLVTVSEPIGEPSSDPVMSSQVMRQLMYAQMDVRGHILELAGGTNLSRYSFPEEAVHAGTEWSFEGTVTLPGMPNSCQCMHTYKIVGVEQACGYECVRADMTSTDAVFEMTLPNGDAAKVVSKNSGSIYFSPALGTLVRLELVTKSNPHIGEFDFDSLTRVVQELVKLDG